MKKQLILFVFAILIGAIACEEGYYDYSSKASNDSGTGGSLARFTISGNFLYTVDDYELKSFRIEDEKKPVEMSESYIGFGIETIFAKGDLLFLGARDGVYIYDISTPSAPTQLSVYRHVQSCDPVVVKGEYAYSTLNTAGPCSQGVDELDIINISDPENPKFVKAIPMDSPKGLGISDSLLFVCDNGLKIYDLSDQEDPVFIKKIDIKAVDVIPLGNLLLVATEKGLVQYAIEENQDLRFLSSIYSTL